MDPSTPVQTPPAQPKQPQKLPPLTTGQKVRFILFVAFFIFAIGGWIAWQINESNGNNDLQSHGTRVIGTANGEYYEFTDKSLRSSSTKYKAVYDYTATDGIESTAIGEKVFDSPADVEALEGESADVYYDPDDAGKGTYVTNEP